MLLYGYLQFGGVWQWARRLHINAARRICVSGGGRGGGVPGGGADGGDGGGSRVLREVVVRAISLRICPFCAIGGSESMMRLRLAV